MKRIGVLAVIVALTATLAEPPLSAQGQPPSTALRASYLILRVRDLASSTAFYRDRVGLPLKSVDQERAVFDAGSVALMIEVVLKPPTGPSTGLAAFTEIVLETPDVFASYKAMLERGITFRGKPAVVTSDGTRDLYATNFRDPNGHIITIASWVPRAAQK